MNGLACTPDELEALRLRATSIEPMMRYFSFAHLPSGPLRTMSMRFCGLAIEVIQTTPQNAERTVALRKLLEGKDAAVRAVL